MIQLKSLRQMIKTKIIGGIKRTAYYTRCYLKCCGLGTTLIYLFSILLNIITLRTITYVMDNIFIVLRTPYGKILCTLSDLTLLWAIFYAQRYRCKMRNLKLVIDIGAHIGLFVLYVKKLNPDAKVIAIEPHPLSFKLLQWNIVLNRLNRIVTLPYALSSRPCILKLHFIPGKRGGASTKPTT